MNELASLDIAFIVFYFLVLVGIAIYFSKEENDSAGYFLAGRNISWVAIGASIFASNISSEHFIAVTGVSTSSGLIVGNFEWISCLVIVFAGWFIAPVFIKSGLFTVPEFFERRYNLFTSKYMTVTSILGYVFIKISITLYAGSLLMHEVFGWDIASAAVAMIIVAGFYAIVGGLKAIVHIDILQTALLAIGAIILTIFGLKQVGGISGLHAILPDNSFTMFKPISKEDFPMSAMIFGAPIIGIWYWCTDQAVAQRVLGAKSINHARTGSLFAGLLKLLPMFLFVLPWLIFATLNQGRTSLGGYSIASFLPSGLQGLVIIGLLAPMISCLASCFNSSSTLFTMDIYRYFRPEASEQKLVLVGRLASVGFVLIAMLWTPLILLLDNSVYWYLQRFLACIGPPVVSVFLVGLILPKLNDRGATYGLVAGTLLGVLRLFLDVWLGLGYELVAPFEYLIALNFMHFAAILFAITSVIFVVTSFLSTPSPYTTNEISVRLSTGVFTDALKNRGWQYVNIGLTALLLVLVISSLLIL